MVAPCACGAIQSSPVWGQFLGTRSWSKHNPAPQHCTCSLPPLQSEDKSSNSNSLESLLAVVAEDSGETCASEDALRSSSQEMGASALEKKLRGGDRRGTKRLRSALVNGNGSGGVGELASKKQANGQVLDTVVVRADQNGGVVLGEPLGGAEQKEAKLGRSFSDARLALMPLKKRKLQLMMAMMEEESLAQPVEQESPREVQNSANGHTSRRESGLEDEGKESLQIKEEGEGRESVALDVLAGVAEAELVGSGSPILKAPVKGKRKGGRRARFGGEKGNSSRENSADDVLPEIGVGKKVEDAGAQGDEKEEERGEEEQTRPEGGGVTVEEREQKEEQDSEVGDVGDAEGQEVLVVLPLKQEHAANEGDLHGSGKESEGSVLQSGLGKDTEAGMDADLGSGGSASAERLSEKSQDVQVGEKDVMEEGLGVTSADGTQSEGTNAVVENGNMACLSDEARGTSSQPASVTIEAQEWDVKDAELGDANLSPVSEDGGNQWGAAPVGEGLGEREEMEMRDEVLATEGEGTVLTAGANESGTTHEGEKEAGLRDLSAGSHEGTAPKEIVGECKVKEEVGAENEPIADGVTGRQPSDSFEGNDLGAEQIDLDFGGSSAEEEGPASPPETEVVQTSLAAAVSSAVAAAAAQGSGDKRNEAGGGEGEESEKPQGRRDSDSSRGLESRGSDSGRGSDSIRNGDSRRGSEGGPHPPTRRVVDLRRFGNSREGLRDRRDEPDRWQDPDGREERAAPYRREFLSRGVPRGAPDYHQGWGATPHRWGPGIRRGPPPPSLNAAAVAAARLQSTGFVVNPDGTISKIPELGAGGMYGGGGLRRLGAPGGVPRAVLAYPGMGGPPGIGGLVGHVTRPVMLVPGRGLVEVPYPGPRPMMGGPPPRYPPGWRRGRSMSPPPPARQPPLRVSYHGASPARGGRSRSRSRSPPPPRNREFRNYEWNGSRGGRDPSPPPPRTRTPPPRRGGSTDSPRGIRNSSPVGRKSGGSESDYVNGGRNGQSMTSPPKSGSPIRKRGGSGSRDDSRSPPERRKDASVSPVSRGSPPKSRRVEKGGNWREGRGREGSYSRDGGDDERPGKDRSSRRYESPPPRRRVSANGTLGSALTDERDRAMLESVQRG